MKTNPTFGRLMRSAVLASAIAAICSPVMAQDQGDDDELVLDEIITTGTRIKNQNVVAASPITTIGAEEIAQQQTPNIERVFRDLPITIPGDGENVNNGTAGQATLDLRGLGPERSLILIDGKRLAPFDINGIVSTDVIPVNMLERVDVVTGGASAVYGSDALSGAVNFVMKRDFEGFEIDLGYSDTAQGGEDTYYINALMGVNFDGDRGNITIGGGRTSRGAILLADRDFGIFGVSSSTGSGLGSPPPEPSADCSGNTEFTTAHSSGVGSTTSIPATLNLRSGNSYQFRDDGSLVQGECARFNFNPFNYYQTPQERYQATTVGYYDINDNAEVYARASFSNNRSDFQIAPSGTFGTAFTIPVMNPFFSDATRTTIVDDLNAGAGQFLTDTNQALNDLLALPNPTPDDLDSIAALQAALAADPLGFTSVGIQDLNGDGVFDADDAFTSTARRRTLELGPRTGVFDTDYSQLVLGVRGELPGKAEGWNYDVSYQRGESDFVETRDGFTNLTNLAAGINTVSATQCIDANGNVTGAPCTPINIFGPVGSITPEQRDSGYFIAIASDIRKTVQTVWHASIDGTIDNLSLPTADDGLSVAFGVESRDEEANSSPDECLKLAPASCQGGAGGNRLPVAGKYSADEMFVEAILPLAQDMTGFQNVSLELGYRYSDFDLQGDTDSWKAGLSWEIVDGFRFRYMEQQAVRVANVGELFRPVTTGLDNATLDPCSIGNPNPPAPGSELFTRCVNTGMLPSQVGTVPDIISGQVNIFTGTNPNNLPAPETARTRTVGFVWETDMIAAMPLTLSLDYYDIEINDYIDTPTGQESLDLCYILGDPVTCAGIVRIGGALGETGTGTPAFFTNFTVFQAEGLDLKADTTFDVGSFGEMTLNLAAHQYLTNEFQTTALSPVVDCKGFYGTSCDPVPEFRSTLRVGWARNDFDASLLWRHIGDMKAQANEAGALFAAFRSVKSQDYLDLSFGYNFMDVGRVAVLIKNVADEDPPILGNETGSTSFNSGNTFPSLFDSMGRTYNVNLKFSF
ncbi:MAG: TonB-dependent receptor plug domain-containing protein [Gammaproteobacteria bacterium]|nr:TonB-dependent receptor plug domain-containing protein [Gammaproteobacteria bacterium]